jgi:nucleoside-diphosphate-sugar epimerase
MMGKYPGLPNIYVPLVDVRDVAEAHIKALNEDVETGRYIVSNRKN